MSRRTKRVSTLGLLTFGLVVAAAVASQLSVSISGPGTLSVPYEGCTTATFTANPSGPVSYYDWTFNSYQVGNGSSYSHTFCNANYGWAYSEDHNVAVYVSGNGQAAFASMNVHVVYASACGTQVICE